MGLSDNKIPMNIYLTRQEKALLQAEAKRRETSMMDVIRIGLVHVASLRRKAKQPEPPLAKKHAAPWRQRLRKKMEKRAAKRDAKRDVKRAA